MLWKPTPHAVWIIPLTIIPFVLVGIFILTLAAGTCHEIISDYGISKRLEFFLLGIFFITSPFIGYALIFFKMGRENKREFYLQNNGIPAKALLITCHETGTRINNSPLIALELEITRSNGEKYHIIHKEIVSIIHFYKLVPKTEIPIFIDPNNDQKIMIDWNGEIKK